MQRVLRLGLEALRIFARMQQTGHRVQDANESRFLAALVDDKIGMEDMKLELEAMAMAMPEVRDIRTERFRGVLTLVGVARSGRRRVRMDIA